MHPIARWSVWAVLAAGCLGGRAVANEGGGTAGWSVVGVGTTSVEKGEKGSRILTYAYNAPSFESEQSWTMSKVADETGALTLEWNLDGLHGFFRDWVEIYAFADGPSGTSIQTLVATPHAEGVPGEIDGPFTFSGEVSLDVTEGYAFGFIVKGANFDCCSLLTGTMTVKERD